MAETGTTHAQVAEACNVRIPSVYGWLKTGRVAKRHLLTFVDLFGRPLQWWLGVEVDEEEMLTAKERDLVQAFRSLAPELQKRLLDEASFLKSVAPPTAAKKLAKPS